MFGALRRNNNMGTSNEEEEENLLGDSKSAPSLLPSRPTGRRRIEVLPALLIISVSLNTFLGFVVLVSLSHRSDAGMGSYEDGFATDLQPAVDKIGIVVKTFTGGVEWDRDGNLFLDQGGHEYVGPPSAAVDEAWETLLGGLNLDFDQDEANLGESTFRWPESGFYFSGLDVYHSLHCLNRLRQAAYPEHYPHVFEGLVNPSRINHIDHCINHIRQSLQCHADLTPMEWVLMDDGSRLIIKTDTPHTCRDFDRIDAWAAGKRTQFGSIRSFLNGSLRIVD